MSSQIFKSNVNQEILHDFLEKICVKTEKYFIINKNAFKKGMFNNLILSFYENIKSHYHISKRKYLEKTTTYNNFCTVIRQICKFNNIMYNSQIKYDKSNYEILYYIYI
jgi:hypothetical protein